MATLPEAGSVGLVETQSVRLFTESDPLHLAAGQTLGPVDVAYETYGTLSPAADNAVFICHALTGDAHAAGFHEGSSRPGWWDNLIGPGKVLDTRRLFVVSANLLGGCQGTTGPSSVDPATGRPYGLDFPLLRMHDFVTVHRRLVERLGIRRLLAVVGGSLGGMQALEWALKHPADMANTVMIAASSRLTAMNIAFSAVARRAIMTDPDFHGGQYAAAGVSPRIGLAIARMMAHITYMSEEALTEKFGRQPSGRDAPLGFGVDFAIESYLEHQGSTFLERFDALSYLYLTRVMDYFDPFADVDACAAARTAAHLRFLVMSFESDWRFSIDHSRRIVRHLEQERLRVSSREIGSTWGHDSFLLDLPEYHQTLRAFMERAIEEGI
ncbi:homoserine O-acetyltransferase MetX [Propionicicella superfundia]|uniref:homoserine O-acetyltransferase MetX n=1 Tax=Propionicicella superfundia TaxID=348582 RepID=UPI00040AC382|nr:homoserine O-acetyltransferase [Propionicicella superfundia]